MNDNCRFLSFEEILKMNKHDNGQINNVISGLRRECYGIWLLNDNTDENYILFYINGSNELSGLACKLNIHEKTRNELTFAFSKIVNEQFEKDTNLLDVYNTFQEQSKTILEKLNYQTYGNEIPKGSTIVVKNRAGIKYVPFFDKTESFKSIFNDLITQDNINSKENRIYLMK